MVVITDQSSANFYKTTERDSHKKYTSSELEISIKLTGASHRVPHIRRENLLIVRKRTFSIE